jgi:hypothetical protein
VSGGKRTVLVCTWCARTCRSLSARADTDRHGLIENRSSDLRKHQNGRHSSVPPDSDSGACSTANAVRWQHLPGFQIPDPPLSDLVFLDTVPTTAAWEMSGSCLWWAHGGHINFRSGSSAWMIVASALLRLVRLPLSDGQPHHSLALPARASAHCHRHRDGRQKAVRGGALLVPQGARRRG